jgi:hypothetical protein
MSETRDDTTQTASMADWAHAPNAPRLLLTGEATFTGMCPHCGRPVEIVVRGADGPRESAAAGRDDTVTGG